MLDDRASEVAGVHRGRRHAVVTSREQHLVKGAQVEPEGLCPRHHVGEVGVAAQQVIDEGSAREVFLAEQGVR